MCSVCERTGWWGYLPSCRRPQNCTYSMSQEIGLSPCVHFFPWSTIISSAGKRASISSCMLTQFCTWLLTVTFWLYCLCCIFPAPLKSTAPTPRPHLQMTFLNLFIQTNSIDHLFFPSFQAAKPADLPDHTTSQGLVAVGEPVAASPDFSDWCGSRDGREGAHLCAAASTAQRWQQR